jgi:hypothetical protein
VDSAEVTWGPSAIDSGRAFRKPGSEEEIMPLVVKHAIYGALPAGESGNARAFDVTASLQNLVNAKSGVVAINNDSFGDPATGNAKHLRSLLVQCAQYLLGRFAPDNDLKRWGMKLAFRGGKNGKKRAITGPQISCAPAPSLGYRRCLSTLAQHSSALSTFMISMIETLPVVDCKPANS